MIRINLLPAGIYEKKIVRMLAMGFAGLAIVIALAGFGYRMKLSSDITTKTSDVEDVEARQKAVQALKAQAQGELAKIGPIQAKVDFIDGVLKHNGKWPRLYEEMAKFTYKKVLYRKITPTATGVEIEAYTPTISDAGRYLINLYRARNIFSTVSISGLPGYPQGGGGGMQGGETTSYVAQEGPLPTGVSPNLYRYGGVEAVTSSLARAAAKAPQGFTFTVSCTLREPIMPPVLGAAPGPAAGAPGMPAGGPAYPPTSGMPPSGPAAGGASGRFSRE